MNDLLKHELLGRVENTYSAVVYLGILKATRAILQPPPVDINYHGGCWYGNDTTWRSVVDITRIIHFADKAGRLTPSVQRTFFSVVDGIVGGDQDGPMKPRTRKCGIIVCGQDMVAVDIVATYLMGFNPLKLNYLATLITPHPSFNLSLNYPQDVFVTSNSESYENLFTIKRNETLAFESPISWQGGNLELE